MTQVTASAPGKLMLFGEHSVVYGKPSIVTAVNQRLSLKASLSDEPLFKLNAPDVGVKNYTKKLNELGKGEIEKGAKFVEIATTILYKKYKIKKGVSIETLSQFKSTFGFGSSSASAVCTIKALSELFNLGLREKEIFDLSYKTVLEVQGVGSGFDLAAAIYGGTLCFVKGGKKIEPLKISNLPLIVGYSGIKADTPTIVKEVKERFKMRPDLIKNIYNGMEIIAKEAKIALSKKDFQAIGKLMNINQGYLEALGVSSQKLSAMIYSVRNAGAYGAKLSGAGVGDCMIALAPPSKRKAVEKAIKNSGGQILKVEVNAKGVKIE